MPKKIKVTFYSFSRASNQGSEIVEHHDNEAAATTRACLQGWTIQRIETLDWLATTR